MIVSGNIRMYVTGSEIGLEYDEASARPELVALALDKAGSREAFIDTKTRAYRFPSGHEAAEAVRSGFTVLGRGRVVKADTRGVAKKREKPTLFWRCAEPVRAGVSKEAREGVDGKVRLGRCYERAAYYVMEHRDSGELVHGTVEIGGGIPISHAWVELGDAVYDGVQGQFYTKSSYYRSMRAVPEQTYTPREAMDKMLETKRFGPWGPSAGIGK